MANRPLKVAIGDEAKEFIDQIAARRDLSGPDVVRKAIAAYKYLQDVYDADGKVVLRRADGQLENLIGI